VLVVAPYSHGITVKPRMSEQRHEDHNEQLRVVFQAIRQFSVHCSSRALPTVAACGVMLIACGTGMTQATPRNPPSVTMPTGATPGALEGATCALPDFDCWAVGGQPGSASRNPPLVVRISGQAWSPVSVTGDGNQEEVLRSVACAAPDVCWAVGSSSADGILDTPLIEAEVGGAWRAIASPNIREGAFADVTCASASLCVAVGDVGQVDGGDAPLIARWSGGATWAIDVGTSDGTSPSLAFSSLDAVGCSSATSCVAVGSANTPPNSGAVVSILYRYAGSAWSQADRTPFPAGAAPGGDISCALGRACVEAMTVNSPGTKKNTAEVIQLDTGAVVASQPGISWALGCGPRVCSWLVLEGKGWNGPETVVRVGLDDHSVGLVASVPAVAGVHGELFGATCTDDALCWVVGAAVVFSTPQSAPPPRAAIGGITSKGLTF
jgi:hypothetical protein